MKNIIIILIFFYVLISQNLFAKINDYIYPYSEPSFSNYGTIGLIQNPTSRFYKNGTLAFSWTHNEPYLRGSLVAYPFDWMEASFQYTDINNFLYSASSEFSGSQSLKDKSFDLKLRVLKETNFLPQLALGIRDLGGTGLFSSEYVVANKLFKENIDLSIGLGWGKLNANSINNPFSYISDSFKLRPSESAGEGGKLNTQTFFSGSAGYFAGMEYFIKNFYGLRLKLEYDATNYKKESLRTLFPASKFNFGIVYPVSKNFQLKLSQTRGNNISFGFSYKLSAGKKNPLNLKKSIQPKISKADQIRVVTSRSEENLYKASLLYLSKRGFNLQKANLENSNLEIVFSQSNYRQPALSAGRTLDILSQIAPENIKSFTVSEINGGMGMYSIDIDKDDYFRNKELGITGLLANQIVLSPYKFDEKAYSYNPKAKYPMIFNTIGPDLSTQIGGPDGFFFGDFKIVLDSEILFSRNISLISSITYGLLDNLDDLKLASDSILPHVRTDIVQYLRNGRDFSIERLQLNFYKQTTKSTFLKISGGILESMFSGLGFEYMYKPYDMNYGIGLEAWSVYQRDYDQMLGLRDYDTATGHINFYYHEPKSNILFHIKGGRYLAKDSGVTFDASRIFSSGLRLGAFFSLTDVSAEEFGEGSFDKGFYFWIPLDIFSTDYNRKHFGWGLKPLTRDGAQTLSHGYPLWGVTDTSSMYNFKRGLADFYD